jgi:hypothetical protein
VVDDGWSIGVAAPLTGGYSGSPGSGEVEDRLQEGHWEGRQLGGSRGRRLIQLGVRDPRGQYLHERRGGGRSRMHCGREAKKRRRSRGG